MASNWLIVAVGLFALVTLGVLVAVALSGGRKK
jgi:hypothetical protein